MVINMHISTRQAFESGGIARVTRKGAERGEYYIFVVFWGDLLVGAWDHKDKLANV